MSTNIIRPKDVHCTGGCKHTGTYHVVRIADDRGGYSLACCKVDCRCMNFEPEAEGK